MKGEINLLVRIAVALFIVFCLVTIIDLQIRMNNLDKQKEVLTGQMQDLQEEIAELEYNLRQPYDDSYAAKVARKVLKYHFPDEILFVNDLYEN